MAEQLLHGAQVAATLHEVRGEGVTQSVRSHPFGQAERLGVATDDQEDTAARQATAAIVDKQRIGILSGPEVCAAAGEVALDGAHGLAATRHDALAAALP